MRAKKRARCLGELEAKRRRKSDQTDRQTASFFLFHFLSEVIGRLRENLPPSYLHAFSHRRAAWVDRESKSIVNDKKNPGYFFVEHFFS